MEERAEPAPERRGLRNPIERLGLPHAWTVALDWILTIAGAVAIVLAIKAWVVNPYRIPTSSMEPRLHCAQPGPGCLARFSDRVLANRFIYHFKEPERGDIVVFETPPRAVEVCESGFSTTFVKRLVGLPGDVWEERNGVVFINGRRLAERYLSATVDRRDYPPTKVPRDNLFVMGDNRTNSNDSRFGLGFIPYDKVVGRAFVVIWPPSRVSWVRRPG